MSFSIPNSLLVWGELLFDQEANSFDGATLYITLEDTSYLDVPSRIVLQQIVKNVAYDTTSRDRLIFSLYGEVPDQKATYTLNVLIDLDGDGHISPGDYINVESYPVLTYGYPKEVSVQVKQIN